MYRSECQYQAINLVDRRGITLVRRVATVSESGLGKLVARGDKTKAAHFLEWADTVVFQRKRSEFPLTTTPSLPAITAPTPLRLAGSTETRDELTMSSLEIAERTGKDHRNVMRDIRKMLDEMGEGGMLKFEHTHQNPQNGQTYPIFRLPKRECLILVSGYSIPLRAKIVDRWMELEAQVAAQATPVPALPDFNDPVAAARAWADAVEKTQEAEKLVEAREKEVKLLSADVKHAQEVIHENLKLVGVAEWCASRHIYLRKPMKNRLSAKTKELHIARGVSYSKQFRMVPLPDGTEKPGHINIYHADLMDEAARDMGLDFTPVRF